MVARSNQESRHEGKTMVIGQVQDQVKKPVHKSGPMTSRVLGLLKASLTKGKKALGNLTFTMSFVTRLMFSLVVLYRLMSLEKLFLLPFMSFTRFNPRILNSTISNAEDQADTLFPAWALAQDTYEKSILHVLE
ncbi:hypothetical protein llap_7701 [Limosa lapponica baueri]|uniref:Uncharacterized protein n=1 Tax=Limosa lapponica baueri TaxID=1758121 RepID=A0A2I0U7C5_LIMLA|nr:hypothetical protein llap_7701 [Limosa lapponica baueri]